MTCVYIYNINIQYNRHDVMNQSYPLHNNPINVNQSLDQLKTSIDTQGKAIQSFKTQIDELKTELSKR